MVVKEINDSHTAAITDGVGKVHVVCPKNTAVIIVADALALTDGIVSLKKLPSTTVTAKDGNILQGSDTDITPSGTVYVLGVVNSTLGFYPFSGSTIPAGKAYY